MKSLSILLTLAALLTGHGLAQMNHTMVGEDTVKISDHVWAIMGFPNIAIVVGSRATLVVDTGMGREKWSHRRRHRGQACAQ